MEVGNRGVVCSCSNVPYLVLSLDSREARPWKTEERRYGRLVLLDLAEEGSAVGGVDGGSIDGGGRLVVGGDVVEGVVSRNLVEETSTVDLLDVDVG